MKIGAQLFTVRDFCKTEADLSETLKKIADIGYTTVQLSQVCACDPEWLQDQLKQNGLQCVLTHTASDLIRQKTDAVIRAHHLLNCGCVGLGYFPFHPETLREDLALFYKQFDPVVQKLQEAGKYFMYHNHAQEFQVLNGRNLLEHLSEHYAPELLGFTLDTYWVQAGGGDPAQWIEKLSGRLPCIHLKDYAYTTEPRMAPVGDGNINFDRVFEKAESAGTRYMLVEQDDCYGADPFECLARSYRYLRSCGFN